MMARSSERASEAEWQEVAGQVGTTVPAASDEDWLLLGTTGTKRFSPQSGFEDLGGQLPAGPSRQIAPPAHPGPTAQASGIFAVQAVPVEDAAPAREHVDVLRGPDPNAATSKHESPVTIEQLSGSCRSSTSSLFFSVPPSPWSPLNMPAAGGGLRATRPRHRSAAAGTSAIVTGPRAQQLAQLEEEYDEEDGEFETPFAFGLDHWQAQSALSFGSALDSSESLVVVSPLATPTMPVRFTPSSDAVSGSAQATPVASVVPPLSSHLVRQLRSISEADDSAHAELSPFEAASRSFTAFDPLLELETGIEPAAGADSGFATNGGAAAADNAGAAAITSSGQGRASSMTGNMRTTNAGTLVPARPRMGPLRSVLMPAALPPPTLLDELVHSSARMLLQSYHVIIHIGQRILAAFCRLGRLLTRSRSRRSGTGTATVKMASTAVRGAEGKAKATKSKRPAAQ